MGQLGEASYVVFFDPGQTLRTFVDMKTIGADREGAYATYEVVPESDVKADSAYIAKENPLLTLPKLQNGRGPELGCEHPVTGDAHFTKHTLSSNALSLNLQQDLKSAEVFT